MNRALGLTLLSALFFASSANASRWIPEVGLEFDHFGESYRISDDQDTVSTINDLGSYVGVTWASDRSAGRSFRVQPKFHWGQQARQARLDLEASMPFGGGTLSLDHDGAYRFFDDDGDYSIVGDYFQDFAEIRYVRPLGSNWRLRLRESIDVTWYDSPNEYNLNSIWHRPGVELGYVWGTLSEVSLGYRLGRRTVPDSTSLSSWRHTVESNVALFFGWATSLELNSQLERRLFPQESTRESSWESRFDARFELATDGRMTYRLLEEVEILRFDEPDELDFDSSWSRTGVQAEWQVSRSVDLTFTPLYAFLESATLPDEEYSEVAFETGVSWTLGTRLWLHVTHEIGRRDYELGVTEGAAEIDFDDPTSLDDLEVVSIFSDYLYNRFTVLLNADLSPGVSANLFVNWEPEDHQVSQNDTDTRIVSGGLTYEF